MEGFSSSPWPCSGACLRWTGARPATSLLASRPTRPTPARPSCRYTQRAPGAGAGVGEGAADGGWLGAEPELVAERRGAGVDELIARIDKAARAYPWAGEYTMWPGPNSNTFTAWVARAVPELEVDLPPTAIGKDYTGAKLVGSAPSGRGFQMSLFGLLGLTASAVEGVEVNLLGLTFGLNP